jgi:hypothetical protein
MPGSSVAALLAHFRPHLASMLAQPPNEAAEPAQPGGEPQAAEPPAPATAPAAPAGPVIDQPQAAAGNAPAQPPPSEEVEEQVGVKQQPWQGACSRSIAALRPPSMLHWALGRDQAPIRAGGAASAGCGAGAAAAPLRAMGAAGSAAELSPSLTPTPLLQGEEEEGTYHMYTAAQLMALDPELRPHPEPLVESAHAAASVRA